VDNLKTEPLELWNNVTSKMKKVVSEQAFATWFEPIKPVSIEKESLTLEVPSKFYYEWIDSHYGNVLLEKLKEITGENLKIRYSVVIGEPISNSNKVDTVFKDDGLISPVNEYYDSGSKLNKRYTFDNFVEGANNQLAKAASISVAKALGETAFNPLLIYGGVGLGKTHLIQAVGNEVIKDNVDTKVHYTTSEKFTLDFISAIQKNNSSKFSEKYRNADLLLVDDIQFLQNKEQTQEQFFHTFNDLYQRGKQIILTTDRHPSELNGLKDRLLSRFQSGLIVDIQAPSLETRMAILQKKAEDDGLSIPFEITELIATNVRGNIREMEGALIKLLAYSSLSHSDINMPLAKKALHETLGRSESKKLTIDDIIQSVSDVMEISEKKIIGRGRKMEVVSARQIAMYLSREIVGASLENIGLHFGGRDHSTVIHACKSIKIRMKNKPDFKEQINSIRTKVEL
tara:strand:+ start:119 stop:1489 length:1371 start_codon:yes stop_codon:yes gene_type:complete